MKKILIVDDEPTILMTLSHLLSNRDTTVITSSRMEEAEEALARYKFDLVIAAPRLSGMDCWLSEGHSGNLKKVGGPISLIKE